MRVEGGAATRWAGAARVGLIWLLAGTPLSSQDAIRTAHDASRLKIAYETLVERYGQGEHDQALAELLSWSDEALERATQEARGRVDPAFRASEIAIRLDAALARIGDEGVPGFARRVESIEKLDRNGLEPRFRTRWRLAVGSVCLRLLESGPARHHLRAGLDVDEEDPLLMVALGAAFEQPASVPIQASAFLLRSQPDPGLLRRQLLGSALDLYERALEADPDSADAHLRLAWTHHYEGHADRAAPHVAWLLGHEVAPDVRYVAALLAGRALETEGALRQALDRYRSAWALAPASATAALAASHVASRLGDEAGASEALLRALRARDEGEAMDAWQGHYLGRRAWLQVALEDIARMLGESR